MAQKLTLTEYLRRRGAIKALTKIEADAFGIPWPLQSGWPARYGAMEITAEMLDDLQGRMATARNSTASKARRGFEGMRGKDFPTVVSPACTCQQVRHVVSTEPAQRLATAVSALFPGFILRQARRYRLPKSPPYM